MTNMKETQPKHQEPTEQHAQVQAKKHKQYKGRLILKPGHKVWEVNLNTGVIEEAKYEALSINLTNKHHVKSLVEKEDCIYIPALNKANAQRKFDDIVRVATSKVRSKK